MAEIRVSHLVMIAIPVAALGCLGLVCVGAFNIPAFEVGGFKFGGINKKDLEEAADQTAFTAAGYKTAKTPSEAMDSFHKAVQARQYTFAARYCTKGYAEQLRRAHPGASSIGDSLDRIRNFGTEKGMLNDVLTYALYKLDPFPKNFKVGPAPTITGDTAHALFSWEAIKYDNPNPASIGGDPTFRDLDPKMFKTLLAQPIFALTKISLIKEGEDWKLDIPSTPAFETDVSYFIDHHKSYKTALTGFVYEMNRLRNATKSEFFSDVVKVLKESK